MRVLHTADWHLGGGWGDVSRRDDQDRVLNEILALCETQNVDLLLVAGDVFSDRMESGRSLTQVARALLERLRAHLRRGRAVFLLRGNHDNMHLFSLMRVLANEMAGTDRWPLVIADVPGVYPIPGHNLQVVALPYVAPQWLHSRWADEAVSPEAGTTGAAGLLALQVETLYRQAAKDVPAVFAGHILVSGAHLTEDREAESAYHREVWLEPGRLPQFTSYNALGHIHLCQEVKDTGKPTWYSGGPDRLNLGERDYSPRVLLATMPDRPGGVATVEEHRLTTCTLFVDETLNGPDAVGRFCSRCDGANPLGIARIEGVTPAERPSIHAQLRHCVPRVRVEWAIEDATVEPPAGPWVDPFDVTQTVKGYLERLFAGQPERRARLEAAFEELWHGQGEVSP